VSQRPFVGQALNSNIDVIKKLNTFVESTHLIMHFGLHFNVLPFLRHFLTTMLSIFGNVFKSARPSFLKYGLLNAYPEK
jgi:hypothetical protein